MFCIPLRDTSVFAWATCVCTAMHGSAQLCACVIAIRRTWCCGFFLVLAGDGDQRGAVESCYWLLQCQQVMQPCSFLLVFLVFILNVNVTAPFILNVTAPLHERIEVRKFTESKLSVNIQCSQRLLLTYYSVHFHNTFSRFQYMEPFLHCKFTVSSWNGKLPVG